MRCGRINVVAGLQFVQPSIGLRPGHMQAGSLVVMPGVECFLSKRFALSLTRNILFNGLAHQVVHRAAALVGQRVYPRFQRVVKAHCNGRWVMGILPYYTSLQLGIALKQHFAFAGVFTLSTH